MTKSETRLSDDALHQRKSTQDQEDLAFAAMPKLKVIPLDDESSDSETGGFSWDCSGTTSRDSLCRSMSSLLDQFEKYHACHGLRQEGADISTEEDSSRQLK